MDGEAPRESWAPEGTGFDIMAAAGPACSDPPVHKATLRPLPSNGTPPRYDFGPAPEAADAKLVSIDATPGILAHGEANEEAIWWLLASQVEE